jgi:hypothetical protein
MFKSIRIGHTVLADHVTLTWEIYVIRILFRVLLQGLPFYAMLVLNVNGRAVNDWAMMDVHIYNMASTQSKTFPSFWPPCPILGP